MQVTLTADSFVATNSSYYDETNKKHMIWLEYCDLINNDAGTLPKTATLEFTYDPSEGDGGDVARLPPQTVELVPGPWNLANSDFVEDSGIYGCLVLEPCHVRIDPRDDGHNLVRLPGLIHDGEYSFILQGPSQNSVVESQSIVFHDLIQSSTDPFEYRIVLNFVAHGLFNVYARVNGTEAPVFPIVITVSSITVDPDASQIEDIEGMDY